MSTGRPFSERRVGEALPILADRAVGGRERRCRACAAATSRGAGRVDRGRGVTGTRPRMTSWRKRLARMLMVTLVGGLAGGGITIYALTNNAAVRQQVIEQLRKHFVGAEITLAGARFRLLGGITLDNLTLYRRDDPSQTPFLHVPSGVIYHDKELLTQGRLAVRKIKLERPRFTIVRGADGRWNVDGVLGSVRPAMPIP